MNNHANKDEMETIMRLEAKTDLSTGPIGDMLELAQLYIEPSHREADAINILETALKREPGNTVAKFWLAYTCLHYLMSPSALERAAQLLQSVIEEDPRLEGAAYLLKAEVLEELGSLSLSQKIKLLEASVKSRPNWVYNRQSLAWAYAEAGRFPEAIDQINEALENIQQSDPTWSIATRNFEESISGTIGHRVAERLHSDLKKVEQSMGRNPQSGS